MKRIVLLGALLGALIPAVVAQAGSATVAQVTNDSDSDAETSIAVNPKNALNLVAGWISARGTPVQTCGYSVSFDGGRTWPVVGIVPGVQNASGGAFDVGTDPSVTFDKNGNAYFTCLGFNNFPPGTGSAGALLVSKSTDGGVTWGTPVAAIDDEAAQGQHMGDFVDHQFITNNPATGALYLTETDFNAFGKSMILFTQSRDAGQTWSAPVRINDMGGNATFQESYTAVGKDPNTIYVVFGAFSNTRISDYDRIYIAKSTDGGTSFSTPQLLREITPLPSPLPNGSWRTANNLWLAVDRATNQLYINFSDYDAGDADVKVMRVRDAGNRFEVQGVTRVNNDRPGTDQFFPFITLAGGRVDVCFQDRSYAPGNALLFTTCAFSTDGGLSFTNQQVTTTGFDASNDGTFIGDYNMQASTATAVSPIFVGDSVPGGDRSAMEVFVARVTP